MSASNPYYEPGADDDVLFPDRDATGGTNGEQHILDGSECWCGTEHHLHLPPDVPPEVVAQLSKFIDKLPEGAMDIVVTSENGMLMKLFKDFLEFAEEIDKINVRGPLTRAIAETVDRLAGGGVIGPLVRFYEAEQYVIGTHTMMKTLNGLRETMIADTKMSDKNKQPILEVMSKLMESTQERLAISIKKYKEVAAETGNDIDPQVTDAGVYSEDASYFASRLIQIPIVKNSKSGEDEDDES